MSRPLGALSACSGNIMPLPSRTPPHHANSLGNSLLFNTAPTPLSHATFSAQTAQPSLQAGRGMMAFEAIMGGALGDHALPEAHGILDVLYWVHTAKHEPSVKQRM